jgi:hypothetical protein
VEITENMSIEKLLEIAMAEDSNFGTRGYACQCIVRKFAAAQQSVHLTALRRGLAVSILFNVVLLAVVLITIGGR